MKKFTQITTIYLSVIVFFILSSSHHNCHAYEQKKQIKKFTLLQGTITDSETQKPVSYATVLIKGTTTSTISNSEGKFELKIPYKYTDGTIQVSCLGYQNINVDLSKFEKGKELTIQFSPERLKLETIKVQPKDASEIIKKVLDKRKENYDIDPRTMTGFYRETIQKRKKYVAVSEAVVEIYKQPFYSSKQDNIHMLKGRKNTDISKIDTILFKLQGGPHTALMLDIIKDPYMILSNSVNQYYNYTYSGVTQQDNTLYYVIDFDQRETVETPYYYGKIFIHSENLAIANVTFALNLEDKVKASNLLIKKKPFGAKVYPTITNYQVQYREENGKWHFNYSRAMVEFKVKWKRKLFNTKYRTQFELAVTDLINEPIIPFSKKNKISSSSIINEEITGFTDKDFWGEFNVIRPEEPINRAIEKIRKNIVELNEE